MLETLLQQLRMKNSVETEQEKNASSRYRVLIGSQDYFILNLPHCILFQASLGLPLKPKGEAFITRLMRANFLGQGTGGAVISLDPADRFFTLTQCLIQDISYRDFHDHLELFINYADYWREEIGKEEKTIFDK